MTLRRVEVGEHDADNEREYASDDWLAALDSIPVAVLAFGDAGVVAVNDCWQDLTGLGLTASSGERWLSAVHADDRPAMQNFLTRARAGSDAVADWRLVARDGRSAVWAQGRARYVRDEAPVTRVLTFTEIDGERPHPAKRRPSGSHDSLTGLLNPRAFAREVDDVLSSRRFASTVTALVLIDLEHCDID